MMIDIIKTEFTTEEEAADLIEINQKLYGDIEGKPIGKEAERLQLERSYIYSRILARYITDRHNSPEEILKDAKETISLLEKGDFTEHIQQNLLLYSSLKEYSENNERGITIKPETLQAYSDACNETIENFTAFVFTSVIYDFLEALEMIGKSFQEAAEELAPLLRAKFTEFYPEKAEELKKAQTPKYRTRKQIKNKIPEVADRQEYLSIITRKDYTDAFKLGFTEKGFTTAGILKEEPDESADLQQLELSDFIPMVPRLPQKAKKKKNADEGKKEELTAMEAARARLAYNYPFLNLVFTYFEAEHRKTKKPPISVNIRRTDLIKGFTTKESKEKGTNKTDLEELGNYDRVVQRMPDGSFYRVLMFGGYNPETDTVLLVSPFMQKMIEEIENDSVKRTANGKPIKSKSGEVQKLPDYSRGIISAEIVAAKNKAAAQNVIEIVRIICRTGKNKTPHVGALTLLQRNADAYIRYLDSANRRQFLARLFGDTWDYLEKYAGEKLREKYSGIQLPEAKDKKAKGAKKWGAEWIPVEGNLKTLTFEFKKKRKPQEEQA